MGSYDHIAGGFEALAYSFLLGAPWYYHELAEKSAEDIWDMLVEAKEENCMISVGSYLGTGDDQDQNAVGIPYTHALSVLDIKTMNNTDGEEVQLVQIRNPWGSEYFNGTWSDVSDSWNHELLK